VSWRGALLGGSIGQQGLGQAGVLGTRQHPARHIPRVDVDGPLDRVQQLDDVPPGPGAWRTPWPVPRPTCSGRLSTWGSSTRSISDSARGWAAGTRWGLGFGGDGDTNAPAPSPTAAHADQRDKLGHSLVDHPVSPSGPRSRCRWPAAPTTPSTFPGPRSPCGPWQARPAAAGSPDAAGRPAGRGDRPAGVPPAGVKRVRVRSFGCIGADGQGVKILCATSGSAPCPTLRETASESTGNEPRTAHGPLDSLSRYSHRIQGSIRLPTL